MGTNVSNGLSGDSSTFQMWAPADLRALPALEWQIEGILPEGALSALYGLPGCYKSFLALDMSLSIAYGVPFLGRPVKQARTVYVIAEGGRGFTKRVDAWFAAHKIEPGDQWQAILEPVNFVDDAGWRRLGRTLCELAPQPGLVFIDTLARCIPGVEENSANELGRVIAHVGDLQRLIGLGTLLVHHTGKNGEDLRGSNSLEGAIDTGILVRGSCKGEESLAGLRAVW